MSLLLRNAKFNNVHQASNYELFSVQPYRRDTLQPSVTKEKRKISFGTDDAIVSNNE
jgi:hypothetical protein